MRYSPPLRCRPETQTGHPLNWSERECDGFDRGFRRDVPIAGLNRAMQGDYGACHVLRASRLDWACHGTPHLGQRGCKVVVSCSLRLADESETPQLPGFHPGNRSIDRAALVGAGLVS